MERREERRVGSFRIAGVDGRVHDAEGYQTFIYFGVPGSPDLKEIRGPRRFQLANGDWVEETLSRSLRNQRTAETMRLLD